MIQIKDNYKLCFIATLLFFLGIEGRELWSLETRWANIVLQMLQSQDYLHPLLKGDLYYDKPLLSYWLIVICSKLLGHFSVLALRLPSVMAALTSIFFTYQIAKRLFDKQTAQWGAWLLVTTFYFVFWGRVASADMLNVVGTLAACWWFFRDPQSTSFLNYVVFFQIIAWTCLCKGLLGVVLPGLILAPYLSLHHLWKRHLNIQFFVAIIPAIIIYLLPFILSESQGNTSEGLSLVVKENITRFFAPFDHKGPWYTYFIYMPIYLLPWTPFFLMALWQNLRGWQHLSINTRWLMWVIGILFIFFSLSGSRRSYYILPLVPFAQLLTAVFLRSDASAKLEKWREMIAMVWIIFFGFALPWYYSGGGLSLFGQEVIKKAEQQYSWNTWRIVMLDVDNKVPFYVKTQLPFIYIANLEKLTQINNKDIKSLFALLAINNLDPKRTIFISRSKNRAILEPFFSDYQIIESSSSNGEQLFSQKLNPALAFVPTKLIR